MEGTFLFLSRERDYANVCWFDIFWEKHIVFFNWLPPPASIDINATIKYLH